MGTLYSKVLVGPYMPQCIKRPKSVNKELKGTKYTQRLHCTCI